MWDHFLRRFLKFTTVSFINIFPDTFQCVYGQIVRMLKRLRQLVEGTLSKIYIFSDRSDEPESSAGTSQNDTGIAKPEAPQVDEATQERYRQIFKSYMHVYLDTRARQKGYASFFDYCEFNPDLESKLLDVTKERSREAGIHPWWDVHTKKNPQLPLNLDGIPVGPYLRVLVIGPETQNKPSVEGMKKYLEERGQFCLSIGEERSDLLKDEATGDDQTKNELKYDCVINLHNPPEQAEAVREKVQKFRINRWVQLTARGGSTVQPPAQGGTAENPPRGVLKFVPEEGSEEETYRNLWKACIDPQVE